LVWLSLDAEVDMRSIPGGDLAHRFGDVIGLVASVGEAVVIAAGSWSSRVLLFGFVLELPIHNFILRATLVKWRKRLRAKRFGYRPSVA
jgi:hypothetical protein